MALTPKQQRFVDEYLIDLNATQAAIRAGYSKKTAQEQSARLLSNVMVQQRVQEQMKAREQRTGITQDRVLKELARIAFFDIRKLYHADGSLKRPDELDDDAAAVLSGIDVTEMGGNDGPVTLTKKAKVFDKTAALTLAMRHLGMLKDKVEHSGEIKNPELKLVLNGTQPAPPPDAGVSH
jgi:phage terminase small subunit